MSKAGACSGTLLAGLLALALLSRDAVAMGGPIGPGTPVNNGRGGNGNGRERETVTPGDDKSLAWENASPEDARTKLKPILLYVYEPLANGKTENHTAAFFQKEILPKGEVKKGAANFTCVKLARNAESKWPASLRAKAEDGAAFILMTCDGQPVNSWMKDYRPTLADVVAALFKTAALNATAKARLEAKDKPSAEALAAKPLGDVSGAKQAAPAAENAPKDPPAAKNEAPAK